MKKFILGTVLCFGVMQVSIAAFAKEPAHNTHEATFALNTTSYLTAGAHLAKQINDQNGECPAFKVISSSQGENYMWLIKIECTDDIKEDGYTLTPQI
jgi:hypothetical protein